MRNLIAVAAFVAGLLLSGVACSETKTTTVQQKESQSESPPEMRSPGTEVVE